MKLYLSKIQEGESQTFEEEIQPEDLDIDIGVMHFKEPLNVVAEVYRDEDNLDVQLHIEGERSYTCSACLEEFNNVFEKDTTLHYDIRGLDSVTLDQDIRDEVLVDHPIRVLCRPSCKGLCPSCGANLNNERCGCQTQE